jgi:hypothetical protein
MYILPQNKTLGVGHSPLHRAAISAESTFLSLPLRTPLNSVQTAPRSTQHTITKWPHQSEAPATTTAPCTCAMYVQIVRRTHKQHADQKRDICNHSTVPLLPTGQIYIQPSRTATGNMLTPQTTTHKLVGLKMKRYATMAATTCTIISSLDLHKS